mmetsp:Transcript_9037/g.19577  ORF Transcript_9037/g.19577 Transcript_9037/m.19577 type:complete len:256 (-) Transcript_9037:203-970(-)
MPKRHSRTSIVAAYWKVAIPKNALPWTLQRRCMIRITQLQPLRLNFMFRIRRASAWMKMLCPCPMTISKPMTTTTSAALAPGMETCAWSRDQLCSRPRARLGLPAHRGPLRPCSVLKPMTHSFQLTGAATRSRLILLFIGASRLPIQLTATNWSFNLPRRTRALKRKRATKSIAKATTASPSLALVEAVAEAANNCGRRPGRGFTNVSTLRRRTPLWLLPHHHLRARPGGTQGQSTGGYAPTALIIRRYGRRTLS